MRSTELSLFEFILILKINSDYISNKEIYEMTRNSREPKVFITIRKKIELKIDITLEIEKNKTIKMYGHWFW